MIFVADGAGKILARTATYFGAQMTMHEWLSPTGGEHKLFNCSLSVPNGSRREMISAYAVFRPDAKWSFLLINKDPINAVSIELRTKSHLAEVLPNGADLYQFSRKQYQWDPVLGLPAKSDPPYHAFINAADAHALDLPPYSLTVLRGN